MCSRVCVYVMYMCGYGCGGSQLTQVIAAVDYIEFSKEKLWGGRHLNELIFENRLFLSVCDDGAPKKNIRDEN